MIVSPHSHAFAYLVHVHVHVCYSLFLFLFGHPINPLYRNFFVMHYETDFWLFSMGLRSILSRIVLFTVCGCFKLVALVKV